VLPLALFKVSGKLGYLLPAIVGVESMGIPSPGETALVLAAVQASQGHLQIWLVIVIGSASAIIGDNIGYLIARRGGRELLERPGPLHKRRLVLIAAGERFFDKHGSKAVFLGRWIAIMRVAAAWMAGISEMRFRTFFLWNALGGITWATVVGLVGFYAGHGAADLIGRFGVYAAIAIGVVVVAGFFVLRRREQREKRELGEQIAARDGEAR
jgi:membrane protein DedA with SNARE-associated domain